MPDKLVLMWAGNANAAPMNANAFGGTIHADPIKQFLKDLLDSNYLSNREMPNIGTETLTISRLTGKLTMEGTPLALSVGTMKYLNTLLSVAEEAETEIEYDALCLGIASPMTPSAELRKGYVIPNFTSFMPSQMDLEDIKTYLTDSAKVTADSTGDRVDLTSLNILFEIPQEYCEHREPRLSEATIINLLSPQNDWAISLRPELMYSIKSDGNLQTISAFLDRDVVRTKTITTNITEELGSTVLNLSAFSPGPYQLTVQATNTKGFMNRKTIDVTLQSADKETPYFVAEQSRVIITEEGKDVRLVFNDHLSAVIGGEILVDGVSVLQFQGRLASFVTEADIVQVEVKDAYDNVLKETIDLTEL